MGEPARKFVNKPDGYRAPESFEVNKRSMIELASAARDKARMKKTQHRDFYVGCTMLNKNGRISVGANEKIEKTDPKHCAERDAMEQARSSEKITAIVVVSTESSTDPNDKSDPDKPLEPCHSCQNMLLTEPCFDEDTILLIVNDNSGRGKRTERQMTIGELRESKKEKHQ